MFEVLIDVENANALITVAMLAAVYDNEKKDYLDIIKPFVCNLLPPRSHRVDLLSLQRKMEDEYGFVKIPIGVLQRIISRLCAEQPPLCSQTRVNCYIVTNPYDNSDFRAKRLSFKDKCKEVSEALQGYLRNERAINLDLERCMAELLRFLDQCGHRILRQNEALRSLPIDERIGRYIACFINIEKENKTSIFDKIIELARGYMVYRCIYFFCQNGLEQSSFSLKNVVIYLDTPLIINALGLDTETGRRAVLDAIGLAQSLGARVTVFEHNVEEAKGILFAYIAAYPRVQSFDLQNLTIKGYSELTLRSIASQIPIKISELLQQEIETAPGLGSSSDWDQINTEEALGRYYIDSIRGKEKGEVKDARIENDVRTLAHALRIRNGDRPKRFESCKVLILSDSKTARYALRSLYDNLEHDEVNLVYSLMDFSCLAWLASPSRSSDIAEDLLLYNAASVLTPSDQIIELMLKYVDELAEAGAIGEDMAFLLRTHPSVKEAVAEVTGNNEQGFTPDMITTIYNRAITNRASEVAASQYKPQLTQLSEQLEHNKSQNVAMLEEIKKRDVVDAKRMSKLSFKAQEKSSRYSSLISKVLVYFLRIIQVLFVLFVLYSIYNDLQVNSSSGISLFQAISAVFALVSALDFFIPKMNYLDKFVNKFANSCGDWIYIKEVERGKRYIDV